MNAKSEPACPECKGEIAFGLTQCQRDIIDGTFDRPFCCFTATRESYIKKELEKKTMTDKPSPRVRRAKNDNPDNLEFIERGPKKRLPLRHTKKPLGRNPLEDEPSYPHLAGAVNETRQAIVEAVKPKPFYTAPRCRLSGPLMTNDDLRERELNENRRANPLSYWEAFRDEMI